MLECTNTIWGLAALGGCVLVFFVLNSVWGLLQLLRAILAPYFLPFEESSLVKKYGSWALITGCTDGIGRAYANELAKKGLNIILVSRSQEKLKTTAQELESQYSVKTKIIAADFSLGPIAIETIKKELGSLEVGILVNNVGKQYTYLTYVGQVDEKEIWDIINVNIGAVTLLCRLLVENMRARGRGAIVNVSSGSEMQPLPLMAVYAATKAYIKSFTAALRYEYSQFGITVQHLAPMFVNTKMNNFTSKLQNPSIFVPTAATYSKHAAYTLGKMDATTGYWSHGLQCFFMSIAPVWIRSQIGGSLNESFRQNALNSEQEAIAT